jgi:hypothetical protein
MKYLLKSRRLELDGLVLKDIPELLFIGEPNDDRFS